MFYYLFLSALSLLPFLFSFDGEFVFDDSEAIVKNKDVTSDAWVKAFSNDFWGADIQSNLSHKSYRPLSILSFRLNYLLSGRTLIASHFKITNIICHTLCCLLVWRVFCVLFSDFSEKTCDKFWSSKAYLSALLFSVHPIHVECVAGVVGRADILAAILFFIAFRKYCKGRTALTTMRHTLYSFKTLTLSGLSMLCKENGVTVLGFCILCEFSIKFVRKHGITDMGIARIWCLLFGIFFLVSMRWLVMGGSKPQFKPIDNPAAFEHNPFKKVMTFQYIYFLNALLLIWPHWLCYDWSMGCVPLIKGYHDYRLVFVALLYVFGYLFLKRMRSKGSENNDITRRQIFLGASLIAVPFLPAANIFYPVGFVVAERILYIPSAGFCMLIVIGLSKIIERKMLRKTGQFFFCLLLITFTLKSWHRSLEWRDEHRLFLSGLAVCPLNAKVHYNVAKVADSRQQTEWALKEYKEAIRLYPRYYQAMNNLANLLKNLKHYDEAELYLRKAVSTKFDFPAAWMNLGIVLANTKRYNESQDAYNIAIKYRKNYPDCYYNLGYLNLEMNQTEKALDNFFQAVKLNPKHNLAWTNILAVLDNTGKVLEATNLIPIVLQELGDSPSVNFAIANIYGKVGRYEDAEKHFLKAIKLFRDKVNPIHYSNLGVLYHRWHKYELARKMYESALKIDPNFTSALNNLKVVKKYLSMMSQVPNLM